MAAPRPKKPIVPRPAKDLSNNPKDLRNKALRDANRAANQNKPRYQQKIGPTQPQGPEAPRYRQKIGPVRPSASSSLAKGLLKKVPVIGTAIGFIADASPAGEGSDKPTGPLMKGNNMKPTFPKGKGSAAQPSTTGAGRPEYPSSNKGKASSVSMTGTGRPEYPSSNKGKKTSGNTSKVGGPGGAKAYENTSGKKSGTSQAASVSPASKGSSRPQTRYQRESLAMEQRRSSGKPKKSIFSLFRKG